MNLLAGIRPRLYNKSMKAKATDILKFLIGWPLSILALIFLIRLILPQLSEVQSAISTLNPFLLTISILFFVGYYIGRTYLWHEMMKRKGVQMSFKKTMHLWSISEINRYIPGNIWSLLSRTMRFAEKKLTKKDIAASLFHETLYVLIGALIISLVGVPMLLQIPYIRETVGFLDSDIIVWIVVGVTTAFIFQQFILKLFIKKHSDKAFFVQNSPLVSVRFLGIASISMFCFGAGYFFAMASVVSLQSSDFFDIVGLSVISLLVGFISFITPTGLGVREGFLTLGLTPLLHVSLAGFAALFARVVLIISEVIFLGATSLLVRLKNKRVLQAEKYIYTHTTEVFLTLSVIIYSVYFTAASFLRFDNFYTGRFDLGNMVQTVWNSSQGRLFLFTHPDSVENVSRLAFHADFILLFFAPFYAVWSHPYLLLLVQTIVVASGAFFLFGIARHILKHDVLSFIISLSYLLNPSLERSNLYDFHAVVLATTFFLAVWYFFLKRKYVWMVVFLILAGITKEQVWAITALFGLLIIAREFWVYKKSAIHPSYLLLSYRFLLGLCTLVISLLLFYLLIWKLIPDAMGGEHFAIEFYGEFGSSPSDIIRAIVFNPIQMFQVILEPERIEYLQRLFLPVGYLPILFPFVLVFALPDLLINLLSSNANLHQIYYQYTATITPFLFISLVYAISLIRKFFPQIPLYAFSCYILIMTLYGAYLYGPLPGGKIPNLAMFDREVLNREEITEYFKTVPLSVHVAATNNAGSHLSEREHIYTIPVGMNEAEYLVFLVDPHPNRDREVKEQIATYLNNPNYIIVKQLENLFVFRKNRVIIDAR